eukprot:CAMPEP_0201905152 /NCGR_PEP_ID=MMETSP0902-20130614/56365_1 /ASSEMBLY_ACC=CAM_ASM_000551 /TAXON_ID=420261 /ORGANISM="Thalassiosira antarctica, Strain CCMP982" /LENGTH=250 /DNA_ID=CAMNT_0048439259 /DNA_START=104 /DNA_END=854 /DNA_ORIENTATION=-
MKLVKSLLLIARLADLYGGLPSFGVLADSAAGGGNDGSRQLDKGRAGTVAKEHGLKGGVPFANSAGVIRGTLTTSAIAILSSPPVSIVFHFFLFNACLNIVGAVTMFMSSLIAVCIVELIRPRDIGLLSDYLPTIFVQRMFDIVGAVTMFMSSLIAVCIVELIRPRDIGLLSDYLPTKSPPYREDGQFPKPQDCPPRDSTETTPARAYKNHRLHLSRKRSPSMPLVDEDLEARMRHRPQPNPPTSSIGAW